VPEFYYDVNGDGIASAADVLAIIALLNQIAGPSGEGEASPADAPDGDQVTAPMLVVADYSLAQRAVDEVAESPQSTGTSVVAATPDSQTSDTRDWNTADAGVSRDSEFAAWASRRGSLMDDVLDDLLADIATDVENAHGAALAEDCVLSGLKPR
jgi:hypothetical protein